MCEEASKWGFFFIYVDNFNKVRHKCSLKIE